jgi:hypothetical protein
MHPQTTERLCSFGVERLKRDAVVQDLKRTSKHRLLLPDLMKGSLC